MDFQELFDTYQKLLAENKTLKAENEALKARLGLNGKMLRPSLSSMPALSNIF